MPIRRVCGCLPRRGFLGAAAGLGLAALAGGAHAQAPQPFRVDVHHHLYPPDYLAGLGRHLKVPPVMSAWTPERSLGQMDRAGIRTAMLSITAPGVWFGDPAEARRLARVSNEYAAELKRDHPGRFGMYAVLPAPDLDGSLAEIAYALDTLHADGIGMFTNYGDKWLGDPVFAPIYEELNRRKAVLYTHPTDAPCCVGLVPGVADPMIEWGTDTTRSVATMVFNGFAGRYPDIRVIFSHAGGTMPFLIERFEFQATLGAYRKMLPDGVRPALRHFLYDTAQASNPEAMGALMKLVPVSQILFGTDYPYRTCEEHVQNLAGLALGPEDLAAIEAGNARRLMPQLA